MVGYRYVDYYRSLNVTKNYLTIYFKESVLNWPHCVCVHYKKVSLAHFIKARKTFHIEIKCVCKRILYR